MLHGSWGCQVIYLTHLCFSCAQVQNIGVPPHESSQAVQTLAEVVSSQSDVGQPVGVEMTNAHSQPVTTLAEVNPEGQLILTDASGLGQYLQFL